jgi:hypothetical protein
VEIEHVLSDSDTSTTSAAGVRGVTTDKILMTVSCMSVQICVVLLILCIYLRRVYPTLKSLAVGPQRQLELCVRYVCF